ncbi:MAG: YIP1 family protein [Halanaerobiales bacterium]
MQYSKKNYILLFFVSLVLLIGTSIFAGPDTVNLDVPYVSYIYDFWSDSIPSPLPYIPAEVMEFTNHEVGELRSPRDLYVANNNHVFIADTGNNRLVELDQELNLIRVIKEFENEEETDSFNLPSGVFVDESGFIYIADRGNQRIVKLTTEGELAQIIAYPVPEEEGILPEDFNYQPIKVVADKASRLYVLSEDVYEGLLQFDSEGNFQGFIGAPKVTISLLDRFWKWISTDQQQDRMALTLPTEYFNVDIDQRGFIYATVSSSDNTDTIRKLNPSGEDVLRRNGFVDPVGDVHYPDTESEYSITGPSLLVDITVQDYGIYSALDNNRGKVFTYDNDGNLLFTFGYNTAQYGAVRNPAAIDMLGDKILILDSETNMLNVYRPTEYVSSILAAIKYHYNGEYQKSTEMWNQVLKYNVNNDQAYTGIGWAYMRQDEFEKAMENFRLGNNRDDYSEALGLYRRNVIGRNFGFIITGIIILLILRVVYKVLKRKYFVKNVAAAIEESENRYLRKIKKLMGELRYSTYLVFHPFDGFWDLKHEKRGSVTASIIILILVCFTYVFMRQYTGFVFNPFDPARLNIITEFISVIIPFMLWCIVNWSLTTLVEGKGTFKDIFMTSSYALSPIVLFNVPLTIFSNFITMEEQAFYYILTVVAIAWAAYLLFFGIMVTHRFEMKKNFFTTLITIAGMVFIIFLSVLFFNLVEQVYTFVSEIYHEIVFRI